VKPDEEQRLGHDGRPPSGQLQVDDHMTSSNVIEIPPQDRLNVRETAWLSLEFCLLWVCFPRSQIQKPKLTRLSFSYVKRFVEDHFYV